MSNWYSNENESWYAPLQQDAPGRVLHNHAGAHAHQQPVTDELSQRH